MDATSSYIAILEKTNQQLSLWSNPYGLMVMVLTFLVAFVAIGFTILIFRQSLEYKQIFINEMNNFFSEQKKILDAKYDLVIKDLQTQAKSASQKEREALEKEIESLKKERKTISQPVTYSGTIPGIASGLIRSGSVSGSILGVAEDGARYDPAGSLVLSSGRAVRYRPLDEDYKKLEIAMSKLEEGVAVLEKQIKEVQKKGK